MSKKLYRNEIMKLATKAGLKHAHKHSYEYVCEFLGIPYVPGRRNRVRPLYVKNLDTDEETEYSSGYEFMKKLGVGPKIYWYIKQQAPITIGGVKYMMRRD